MTTEPKKARGRVKPKASNTKLPPVYFLSLEVENVLCFKERQTLNLSDGNGSYAKWTVILGDNGVGKTTLLKCLAMLEKGEEEHLRSTPALPAFFSSNINLRLISSNYLIWDELRTLHSSQARINADILKLPSFKESISIKDKHKHPKSQKAQIHIYLDNYHGSFRLNPTNLKEVLTEILPPEEHKAIIDIDKDDIASLYSIYKDDSEKNFSLQMKIQKTFLDNLLCYGYGATRKNGKESPSNTTFPKNSLSLFLEEAVLINPEEWLLQTDYAAKSSSGKVQAHFQKQLKQIIDILKRILPEVDDIHIAQVDEDHPRPRAEFKTPYGWVRLSSLGLGYRTMIAWMVDLAVRLFQRYPDSEDPLAEPAIVLVDEIDLHLHPKWQRTIMEFLTERFPNTQFIVTAHSPLVVQAAQNANIVLLRREGDRVVIDNNPEIIQNWRVDQVLTSVFELPSARPAAIEPLLDRRYEILSKAHLTEADEAELSELDLQIGTLPTAQNSEDIKAMNIIRRAAKLLENSQGSIAE